MPVRRTAFFTVPPTWPAELRRWRDDPDPTRPDPTEENVDARQKVPREALDTSHMPTRRAAATAPPNRASPPARATPSSNGGGSAKKALAPTKARKAGKKASRVAPASAPTEAVHFHSTPTTSASWRSSCGLRGKPARHLGSADIRVVCSDVKVPAPRMRV